MILNKVTYDNAKNSHIFIDVRSPSEYREDSIPNAINIPLMDDEERKAIGTTYKQIGKNEAKRLGVKLISPKMPKLFEQVLELKSKNIQIAAFCARGGYRSTFFASVFSSIGIPIAQLEGGYKEYRKEVITSIPILNEKTTYIVLHGNTGVGKTDILHSLKNSGYSILDLEGAANHRGSLLGSIGIGACNSQKKFETNIYDQLSGSKSQYVFVEAESRKIGKVVIPNYISEKMQNGIHIFIDADLDYRVKSLKKDYIQDDNWMVESINAVERLNKYISKDNLDKLKNEINIGNFDFVARELMQKYYDPMYTFKSDAFEYDAKFKANTNCDEIAREIAIWLESFVLK
ncbi:tRNA 2-selenouridine synthase [Sedimentibacter acidaminivorans]|uniref:tRNA 2-selenouridine synthase n=1 Tax=Sedimentibacter acidaminivorans TaxID=913099 RepID=A0ABS4GFY0_9FIRM|nr:tRNA 2-selenouridine(34) synthase MnmH [Sedimentibacter acidaminivorans]MBP1926601.1 tRNA 2-selenouridine synthase [Sedimentibacter acidaminivorans]